MGVIGTCFWYRPDPNPWCISPHGSFAQEIIFSALFTINGKNGRIMPVGLQVQVDISNVRCYISLRSLIFGGGGDRIDAYQLLNLMVGAVALLILIELVVRITLASLRQRRVGTPGAIVGAAITSQLIGLGLAITGAVGGGRTSFVVLEPLGLPAIVHLIVQVCAALAGSWLIGRAYFGWLAQPVYRWFAGEERAAHDG